MPYLYAACCHDLPDLVKVGLYMPSDLRARLAQIREGTGYYFYLYGGYCTPAIERYELVMIERFVHAGLWKAGWYQSPLPCRSNPGRRMTELFRCNPEVAFAELSGAIAMHLTKEPHRRWTLFEGGHDPALVAR